uniref:Pyr_redox_2 domain-containing protein n=1 Tax=Caenorhabditis tropicalis TaxID=1561998 RepID=A0A1I7SXI8_9PELO
MLLRVVGRKLTSAIRQQTAVRSIAISRIALGGGGHHHEPQPVYIPKPGSLDWSLCSNPHAKSSHEFEPYKPDVGSFVGAAVFIGLTVLAVILKTDTFKKDDGHHHKHPAKSTTHELKEVHAEPNEKHVEPKNEHVEERNTEEAHAAREAPAAVEDPVPSTSKPSESDGSAKPASSSDSTEANSAEPEDDSTESQEKPKKHQMTTTIQSHQLQRESQSLPSSNEEPATSESKEENSSLHCEYVIIGSGTAAYYASLAIRAKQAEAKVLMIGEEAELPYNRPPLSKELWWYGDESASSKLDYTSLSGKKRDIFYEVNGFFVSPEDIPKAVHGGVSLLRGKKAIKICTEDRKVILDDGTTIGYDKVLIATGVRPKKKKCLKKQVKKRKRRLHIIIIRKISKE